MNDDRWFKSSYTNTECVEVHMPNDPTDDVWVRDSKDKGEGPMLKFNPAEWRAFLAGAKDGEFDLPVS